MTLSGGKMPIEHTLRPSLDASYTLPVTTPAARRSGHKSIPQAGEAGKSSCAKATRNKQEIRLTATGQLLTALHSCSVLRYVTAFFHARKPADS